MQSAHWAGQNRAVQTHGCVVRSMRTRPLLASTTWIAFRPSLQTTNTPICSAPLSWRRAERKRPERCRLRRSRAQHLYQRTLLRRAAMRVCQPGPVAFQRSITSSGRRMEISFRGFVERGRPPFFTTARDKASSVSSGSSSYSCGRMECVSTLARSDFKVRRKTDFLTMVSLSHAENMARSASRRITYHH